jgi:hypothetical protein
MRLRRLRGVGASWIRVWSSKGRSLRGSGVAAYVWHKLMGWANMSTEAVVSGRADNTGFWADCCTAGFGDHYLYKT